ncbi:MAG: hypothetical protein KDD50_15305, partial [Bdellovibrionales bacterium]|nr:hypothetical protein [Bdellovibrionales bacterium]
MIVRWEWILTILLLSINLWAGDFLGNGGGGLICENRGIELLDFYEGKLEINENIKLGDPQSSEAEIADLYLTRLKVFSPKRTDLFRKRFSDFYKEATFIDKLPLMEIPDLGIDIPEGCEWKQIVNQNPLLLSPGKKYLIDLELWSKLSTIQKVGLMFHEIIYRESNSLTSKGLRHLNALIAFDKINQMDLPSRIDVFQQAGLAWMEAQGFSFSLTDPFVVESNILVKAIAIEDSPFLWKQQNLVMREAPITFYPNGAIKSFKIKNILYFQVGDQNLQLETKSYYQDPIVLYENGNLKSGPTNFLRLSQSSYY